MTTLNYININYYVGELNYMNYVTNKNKKFYDGIQIMDFLGKE